MIKYIKYVLLVAFFLYLAIVSISVSNIEIQIQLIPSMPTTTMHLGQVIPLFASMAVGVALLVGLTEWLQLRAQNRELQAEMDKLREEVASLRNLMTMERESE